MLLAESIACAYGGKDVLKDATVRLEPGEFVAVVGPNGSGKTTLLRAMSRVLRPKAGRVTLDGRDLYREVAPREAARAIAVVPQEAALDFEFTCHEVVMMGRHPHLGRFAAESERDREVAREAMERTETWALRDRLVTELSGGERRRVLVARAFAQEPRYLLLDEPTSHLDVRFQVEVLRMVRSHGAAVLAVLHDLHFAAAYATRVVLLGGGRVVADGPPEAVLTEARLEPLFGCRLRVGEGFIVPRVP